MEADKQSSILSYLPELTTEQLVDTATQTYLGAPVRFVYFNTAEPVKHEIPVPQIEDDAADDEKQKSRSRHPEKWRQNMRKKNKNQGLEYIRANGEVSAKKEMGPPCSCKLKCYARIGDEACKKVFRNFWKLGDHSLQNAYIAGCVRIFLPKQYSRKKKDGDLESPSRRFFTRYFYVNVNGVDTEICKQAFLNLHSISNGRLDRLLKKKQEAGNTGVDARGRHNNKANKIPMEKIREVRRSIDNIRKQAGFLGKRRSKIVEILPSPLNIRTMYRTYRGEVLVKGLEPVCEFRFRKIFHNDYHIDFLRPPVNQQSAASASPSPVKQLQPQLQPLLEEPHTSSKMDTQHAVQTFAIDDKPVYTTLESKDSATYVTLSQDLYSGYTMQPQSWLFPTQTKEGFLNV